MRVFDLLVLGVALPVFLIAGLPVLGWVTGAGVWAMWRGIGAWADRRAAASGDARVVAGDEAGGVVARGWVMGLPPLGVGVGGGRGGGVSPALLRGLPLPLFFTFQP